MSPRAGLTGEVVVDAAIELVDRAGVEALTLGAIARGLKVRTPSLYSHVNGLPGLHRELRIRGAGVLAARLDAALAGAEGRESLVALCHELRAFGREHPGLSALLQPSAHGPVIDEGGRAAAEELLGRYTRVLGELGFEGDDALHATRAVRSAIEGFVMLEQGGAFGMAIDADESFERLVTLLADGLAGNASSGVSGWEGAVGASLCRGEAEDS